MLVAVFLNVNNLHGQKVNLGIRAGVTNSKFTNFDTKGEVTTGFGWSVSMPVEIKLSKYISVQPELSYVVRSSFIKFKSPGGYLNSKTNYSNIDGYVWTKLYSNFFNRRVFIIVGPEINWLLNGNIIDEINKNGQINIYRTDVNVSRSMRLGVGVGGGVGYSSEVGKLLYQIDGRYQSGWYRVQDPTFVRYRGFTLGVNVLFNNKRRLK